MGTIRGSKPRGITRFLFRIPIWLYRLHLGWLLGDRFLMLIHTGRKSGLPRYAVVEVVRYDPETDTYTIASGWGEKADWFRNIQQEPQVVLYCGRRRTAASAARLSADEAAGALKDYADRHPVAFQNLAKLMLGQKLEGSEADCRTLAQSVSLVALTPHA